MGAKNTLFLASGQILSGIVNNEIFQGLVVSLAITILDFFIKKLREKK